MSSIRRSDWGRVDSILDDALDAGLDPSRPLTAKSRALLARLCENDDEVEGEVLSLLAEMRVSDDALESPLERLVPGLLGDLAGDDSAVVEPIGRTIDRYRLLDVLGRGGMGVVYLAERADDQYDKRVALKLMPIGLESAERERRFRQERQILARLEHPGIARLLDGGMTEDGYPYLVMERIEGQAIDRYCDENHLSIRQRIEIFLEVCEAVQYAHRNLVVHRDIKPGNCLVTGEGRVKLLDFGIAKVLAEDGETERTALQPMTPRYASPEQLLERPISTATDVYSLGALLYRLLCGATPFERDDLDAHRIRDAVVTRDPPAPSDRWRSMVRDGKRGVPGSADKRWERRLRGDLDVILLKALRRDPDERYASVGELALDLRRHLEGHPISARRHSAWMRARKFGARHRASVGVALLLAVSLMTGVAIVVQQGRVAARERDRTAVEAARARRMTRFVTGLLESGSFDALGRGERTARELVLEAEDRIREELSADPIVRASLLEVLAFAHSSFGDDAKALDLAEEAIHTLQREAPEAEIPLARARTTLASVRSGRGDPAEVQGLLEDALRTYGRHGRLGSMDAASTYRALGGLLSSVGRPEEALEHHRKALRILETHSEPVKAAIEKTSLAGGLQSLGRDEESLDLNREALDFFLRVFGPDHPHVSGTRGNMANSLRTLGRYEEAEFHYREALRPLESQGRSSLRVAPVLSNLSRILVDQNRAREAAPYARRAAAIFDATLVEEHPNRVGAWMNVASVELALGNVEEAIRLYREGLEICVRIAGPDSLPTARARSLLGSALERAGRHEEAARLLEMAIERQRAAGGPDLYLAESLAALGRVHESQRRCLEATPLLDSALDLMARTLPAGHWKIEEVRAVRERCTASPVTALEQEARSP